jgi:hypothetical protein
MRHRARSAWLPLGLIGLLVMVVVGSEGESETSNVMGSQTWEFITVSPDEEVAIAQCLPDGSCSAQAWTLLSRAGFGCTLKVQFEIRFRGDHVTLQNFVRTRDSDCSGVGIERASGVGSTIDAPYPLATLAAGTVEIVTRSPIGLGGGKGRWKAQRIS